ncbi:T9SS type A sorting domain-containing protein [candidate division WOR-3 bacterium]|nr:T9SS type A sorting domain-containing protein [candidate division WOR-3 bacterium]
MKRNAFIILLFGIVLVVVGDVYAQGYVFGPNVRVSDYLPGTANCYTPNAGQRGVAVRGDTVYCVWDDDRLRGWGVRFSKSTDGGQTFLPNVQVDDGLGEAYTPTIAVGNDGTIYVSWDGEPSPFSYKQVFFSRSTDGGLTFTPDVLVNDTAGGIKNHPHRNPSMAVDSAGVIYIAYDDGRNGPGNYDIYFSKSTDGGFTFPNDVLVNDTIGDILNDTRPALALSKDSDIYISWNKAFDWLYVSKSTDGGISFSPDVQVNDTVAESWQNSIDVDSRGYVHVTWRDGRDGNANIYYSRSINGGLTFSPNIRVNDAAHEPEPQAYPSMCVDDSGMVYAVWQEGSGIHPDIYFTCTTDNGDSVFVEPNVKVSDVPPDSEMFDPSIAVGDSGKVYVMWSDHRNNFWSGDVYFSVGKYESGIAEEKKKVEKESVIIFTPFPNPFIQTLRIRFQTKVDARFSIKVYDVTGRLVKNIYKGMINGRRTVNWHSDNENGRSVSQGIYFIRIKNLDSNKTFCKKVLKISW